MSLSITLPVRARAQLVATRVRVVRGGRTVLDGVDLAISAGVRCGVIGENGRGKTTLLQVLSGALVPDGGAVQRVGTIGVAEQEMAAANGEAVGDAVDTELADVRAALQALDEAAAALAGGHPGAEEAYARALDAAVLLDAWDADRRVDRALEALGAVTDRTRQLRTLSVGQRYRVRLACLLGAGHDFLLLDEPTNHLDAAGLDFLTARLREHPGGSWWSVMAEAQNRLVTGWRPDKGTGKHQRATRAPGLVRSVHRRRDDLVRHAITAPVPPMRFRMPVLPARPCVTLLSAEDVTVEGRLRVPVSLRVESGSRFLVTGPNGAGKSTLLAVLAGLSLAQESPESDARRAEELVPGIADLGLLPAADRGRPVRELSTGQQRRLDLAVLLASEPHMLLLDEPANHLSITLVDELTEALRVTPAAVVVATHDRQMRRDVSGWPELPLAD